MLVVTVLVDGGDQDALGTMRLYATCWSGSAVSGPTRCAR